VSNYGTLSSDYDAGYDDGFDSGFEEALGAVHKILNGESWNADHLDAITELLTAHGFKIEESENA
jgi:hypothetical protein